MRPVCIYIDGFNLYHALLKFRDNKVKWLDLRLLAASLISPKSEEIKRTYYFSAYADWWPDKMRRHQEYTNALTARGVTCVMGHFKKKDRRCPRCKTNGLAMKRRRRMSTLGS